MCVNIITNESVGYWTLFITVGYNITSPVDQVNKVDSCLVKSDVSEGGVSGGLLSKSELCEEVLDLREKGDDNRKWVDGSFIVSDSPTPCLSFPDGLF